VSVQDAYFRLCIHHGPDQRRCDRCVDEAMERLEGAWRAEEREHQNTYAALSEADAKIDAYVRDYDNARNAACVFAFFLGMATP
jgi:hypothetical protein